MNVSTITRVGAEYCQRVSPHESILIRMAVKKLMQCLILCFIATINVNIYVEVSLNSLLQSILGPCGIILEVLLISTSKVLNIASGVLELIATNMIQV
jgi:hypothetical protein